MALESSSKVGAGAGAALAERRGAALLEYAVAALVSAAAVALGLSFRAVAPDLSPLLLLVVAVAVSANFGGFLPGLLATALTGLAGWYAFIPPYGSFRLRGEYDALELGLLVLVGVATSWLNGALRSALRRAEAVAGALKMREEEVRALNAGLERRVEARTGELESRRVELEQAALALHESEERLREVVRHAPIVLFALDTAGRLTLSEGQGLSALGLRPGEAVGRSAFELYAGQPEVVRNLRRVLTGESFNALTEVGGRVFDNWFSPIRDARGEVSGALGVALDFTERRRAEEALLSAKAELEGRNAEQETFIYTVSHDLRSPLLSIEGMADLLDEAVAGGDPEGAAFLLGRVKANVVKMGDLLNDLLALSRVGRAADEPEVLDLGAVVGEALADLDTRLRTRGATVALPDAWPAVRYPRSEAGQVVANLLGNAAKWAGRAPDGQSREPRIAVAWERADGFVTVRVSDNGPGVPQAYREKVFGLFQKLDAAAEGTGVGLAIVRRVVERHGGRAWVEDSPAPPEGLGGAAFAVTLPAGGNAVESPP